MKQESQTNVPFLSLKQANPLLGLRDRIPSLRLAVPQRARKLGLREHLAELAHYLLHHATGNHLAVRLYPDVYVRSSSRWRRGECGGHGAQG